ncbi:hypothetical protein E4U53_003602, partial [Claviceps sorghi]
HHSIPGPEMTGRRKTKAALAAENICTSLPTILEAGVDQFRNGWAARRISSCGLPEQEVSMFVGPLRPIIDEYWTAEDESWLMATWEKSTTKLAFCRIGRSNPELMKLWRISCSLMRCSPVGIISPQYGLIYDGVDLTPSFYPPDHSECPLWSEGFCKALGALVVHSFWRGDAKLLASCIQYCVICRTDDRQPWKMALSPSSCLDVENLRAMAASPRNTHIHVLQMDYNGTQAAHGRELSLEYEFMCYLGSIIEKPPRSCAEKQSNAHPPVYPVRTADLNVLLHALNTFNPNGFPLFNHSDIFLSASQSTPLHYVFPREDQLCELHKRSFLHESRMAYRNARASRWTPRAPRVFLPVAAASGAGSPAKPLRIRGRTPAPEIITILDDDDKPRLGLASSRNHPWPGPSHNQQGKKRQRQQSQKQSPQKRKKNKNRNEQRQGNVWA